MNELPGLVLRDIHDAPPPSFWPPAPGWWVVAVLALVVLVAGVRFIGRYYRRWRRRRVIVCVLRDIRQGFIANGNPTRLAAELSMLLRRVALSRFPRDQVAGLSGVRWLEFLDETGGSGRFLNGPGRILTTAPYAPRADVNVEDLCALVGEWVKKNV